jgi:hypothetical protein
MKYLALLLLCFVALPARALTPCSPPSFYDGFSGQFPNANPTGFIYGLDETYLYVTLASGIATGFVNVPQGVAQAFNYTQSPVTFYNQQIVGRYHQPLMTENCLNILVNPTTYLLAF